MSTQQIKTRGPLKRISANDVRVLREVLTTLAAIGEPPEQTQRRLFITLIPILYAIRKKFGYTFKQITELCHTNGLRLSQSTIRVYYSQFSPSMKRECEEAMFEMDLITKQIESNTK